MQLDFSPLATIILLPFISAAFVFFIYPILKEKTAYFAALIAFICFYLLSNLYGSTSQISMPLLSSLDVNLSFYVDGLSILLGLLSSGVGILIFIYSIGYAKSKPFGPTYYSTLLVFMGSMLGIVFSADLIVLFLFWELTSFSSYILIGHFNNEKSSRDAAKKALIITSFGGIFMLFGFLILYSAVGTFDIVYMLNQPDIVQSLLREQKLFLPVLLAIVIAASSKSAQIPFHIWLPSAMVAPTPVSAFLHSAAMVKAGVYLLGRFHPMLVGDEWYLLLLSIGFLTMISTAFLAILSTTLKELLAYSTASHIGMMLISFGIPPTINDAFSSVGFITGSFHLLNHAIFKATLFLIAGIITYQLGVNRISNIRGLLRKYPLLSMAGIFASLCMAGVPPFSGFYSKELLFQSLYNLALTQGGFLWILPMLIIFASSLTIVYSLRFIMIFLGPNQSEYRSAPKPHISMTFPILILVITSILITLFPMEAITLISPSNSLHLLGGPIINIGFPTHLSPQLLMSFLSIFFGMLLFYKYDFILNMSQTFFRHSFNLTKIYHGILSNLSSYGSLLIIKTTKLPLRSHIMWLLGTTCALTIPSLLYLNFNLNLVKNNHIPLEIIIVLFISIIGLLAIIKSKSRVMGVLFLSFFGFMVSIFYLFSSAPDVALTQITVETLLLVVFLIILGKVPAYYGTLSPTRISRDIFLSIFVGVMVFFTVIVSTISAPSKELSNFFINRASSPAIQSSNIIIDYGGGSNIVNVILVDFRALDTLGEISVVVLAALSILTILSSRQFRGQM